MAKITLKGNTIQTCGELPPVGALAPDFCLVGSNLTEYQLNSFAGKRKVLSVFPSIDTPTCAMSVRTFNQHAGQLENVVVLNISADLPFAHNRFCAAEGIQNSITLSSFRSTFARDYGLEVIDGPLKGLCSRAVIVLDESNRVIYREQVAEIANEPHYAAVLDLLKGLRR